MGPLHAESASKYMCDVPALVMVYVCGHINEIPTNVTSLLPITYQFASDTWGWAPALKASCHLRCPPVPLCVAWPSTWVHPPSCDEWPADWPASDTHLARESQA